jgi:hypothetical protein
MTLHKLVVALTPMVARIYRVPGLGYVARRVVAFVKRTWLNTHSRRHDRLLPPPEGPPDVWKQHLPAFLNAVSTVGAFGHELLQHRRQTSAAITALAQRLDALEARTSPGAPDRNQEALRAIPSSALDAVRREDRPHILDPAKLTACLTEGLRVNIASHGAPLAGYINVDVRERPGVDIVADLDNLPLPQGAAKEIVCRGVLAGYPQNQLEQELLPYWRGLLAPGGLFRADALDRQAIIEAWSKGRMSSADLRDLLIAAVGANGDGGDVLSPSSLAALLERAGFSDIKAQTPALHTGEGVAFEICAVRR